MSAWRTPLRVKELAMERGFNQQTLSFEARISPVTVRGYWLDYVDRMDRRVLEQLATALGVGVGELFGAARSEESGGVGEHLS